MDYNYAIDYQGARERAGLTREQVVTLLDKRFYEESKATGEVIKAVGMESIAHYERGIRDPNSKTVTHLADMYKSPFMTQEYCKFKCEIGKKYSYEILDLIDISIPATAMKLMEEHRESFDILPEMTSLINRLINTKDFTKEEHIRLSECIQELLDLEHTIEVLKISLNRHLDISQEIQKHNEKCIQRGYAKRKTLKRVQPQKSH